MLAKQVTWKRGYHDESYQESNSLISNLQTVFHKKRGTVDHLIHIEAVIKKAVSHSNFFNLEKANDTTWKHCIMRDLHNLGLRERIRFIRTFPFIETSGSMWDSLFLTCKIKKVFQREASYVTFFSIKLNNIVEYLNPITDCTFNVDDFLIYYRSTHIHIREWQLNFNKINKLAMDNDFKFSKSKTQYVHFYSQRKMHNDPVIKLEEIKILVIDQYKFLVVIFDKN